jgi:hypothetical protein
MAAANLIANLGGAIRHDIKPLTSHDGFGSEEKLVDTFEGIASIMLDGATRRTLREFECGDGIADLVAFDLRRGWEKSLDLADIHPRWAYLLRVLPYRKSFSLSEFTEISGFSRARASSALRQYEELGYCEPRERDAWVKFRQPSPLVNKIHAIEAKLRNWRRALAQAIRYQDYATQSWVLLDTSAVNSAISNIDEFKKYGIGLASISVNGDITYFCKPTTNKAKWEQRFWQANAVIARRLSQLPADISS